jgi:hypothetical protein
MSADTGTGRDSPGNAEFPGGAVLWSGFYLQLAEE